MSDAESQTELQLSLSVPQLNKILESLGGQPYHSVYELINNIQQQCSIQLNPSEAESTSGA